MFILSVQGGNLFKKIPAFQRGMSLCATKSGNCLCKISIDKINEFVLRGKTPELRQELQRCKHVKNFPWDFDWTPLKTREQADYCRASVTLSKMVSCTIPLKKNIVVYDTRVATFDLNGFKHVAPRSKVISFRSLKDIMRSTPPEKSPMNFEDYQKKYLLTFEEFKEEAALNIKKYSQQPEKLCTEENLQKAYELYSKGRYNGYKNLWG